MSRIFKYIEAVIRQDGTKIIERYKTDNGIDYYYECQVTENDADYCYCKVNEQDAITVLTRIMEETNKAWDAIRERRKCILIETDWTQLPDSPLTEVQKEAFRVFRQAWRDITKQADPYNLVIPDRPQ